MALSESSEKKLLVLMRQAADSIKNYIKTKKGLKLHDPEVTRFIEKNQEKLKFLLTLLTQRKDSNHPTYLVEAINNGLLKYRETTDRLNDLIKEQKREFHTDQAIFDKHFDAIAGLLFEKDPTLGGVIPPSPITPKATTLTLNLKADLPILRTLQHRQDRQSLLDWTAYTRKLIKETYGERDAEITYNDGRTYKPPKHPFFSLSFPSKSGLGRWLFYRDTPQEIICLFLSRRYYGEIMKRITQRIPQMANYRISYDDEQRLYLAIERAFLLQLFQMTPTMRLPYGW